MRHLLSVALSAMLISAGAHAAPRVLEPKDLFRMEWAADPQIRSDGTQIAYARTRNDIMTDRLLQSLWLIDVASGAQTPLATGPGTQSSPRWSPDGSRIAYLSTGADGRTQSGLTRTVIAPLTMVLTHDVAGFMGDSLGLADSQGVTWAAVVDNAAGEAHVALVRVL